ncbi:MAG: hypothetical protein ACRDP4_06450 [Nocardioidaceae bacterium]
MYVRVEHPRNEPVPRRFGAAGLALDCTTHAGIRGGVSNSPRYEGAAADSPQDALAVGLSEGAYVGATRGYRLARQNKNRALFVYTVHGRTIEAVIVHDGPTVGDSGWYVESWARCDWSEFPTRVPKSYGIKVWTDEAGQRVPTTTIKSFPDACGYDGMTELHLGKRVYLGNTPASLRDYLAESPQRDVPLPTAAIDTDYHLQHDHLWVSQNRQRVYVGNRGRVDVWPRAVKPLVCG